jgi:tetratricopeptide (TPR) repeat protein
MSVPYRAALMWVVSFALALTQTGALALEMGVTTKAIPLLPPSVQPAYLEAIEKLAEDDLGGAEMAFQGILKRHPANGIALLGLAEVASRSGNPAKAETYIREAVAAEPGNAYAQASMGRLLATQGEFSGAEKALLRSTRIDETLIRPRMDLADLYATSLGKPLKAVELYRSVVSLEPTHAGAHYALGVTLARLGERDEALIDLQDAARLAPQNPLPQLALTRLAMQTGEAPRAMQSVERALEIQPGLAEALELRGDIRQLQGELELALVDYDSAIKAQPNRVSALLKAASVRQVMGNTRQASEAYLTALALDPTLAPAYNNLAWIAVDSGDRLDNAEEWARQAVDLSPENADYHDTLGWVLLAVGKPEEARTALERATVLDPEAAVFFYHLGVVQQELNRSDEAARSFAKALQIDPGHRDAKRALEELGISDKI